MASFEFELRKIIEDLANKHDKKLFILGVLSEDETDFVTCMYGRADSETIAKCHLSMGAALMKTIQDKSEACDCPDCIKEKGEVN
jgi:hypothetical protein